MLHLAVQDHLFTSWKEFEEWKAAEEEETNTCYIQQTEAVPVTQDKENGTINVNWFYNGIHKHVFV